jgi:resuscitation-promoting factor RpfA
VSNSPKRPLDAAPSETPALLQRDLNLDRRTNRVDPSQVPTDPERQAARPEQTVVGPAEVSVPPRVQPPSPARWSHRPSPDLAPTEAPGRGPEPVAQAFPNLPRAVVPPRSPAPHGAPVEAPLSRPPGLEPRAAPVVLGRAPGASALPRPSAQVLPAHMAVTLPGMALPPRNAPVRAEPRGAREPTPVPPARPAPAAPSPATPAASAAPSPGAASAPAVPASATPRASAAEAGSVRATPAGLLRRLLAWLVDLSLIGLFCGLFLTVALLVLAPKGVGLARGLMAVAVPAALLLGVLAFVYAALFAFLFRGRTPGRALAGIRLVDEHGSAPGPARALTRAALSLLSGGLFLSGFWLALFDRRGQTLHDKLTRTFVVRLLDA